MFATPYLIENTTLGKVKLLLQVDMNCSPPRFPSRLLGYFLTSGVANLGRIFKLCL